MKVVGGFNKISEEMKKMLPKLKKGEIKTFQLVTGVRNNDPDEKIRKEWPTLYATWQIPTRDQILDWHTGEVVDICVPDVIKNNEVLSTKVLMPGKGEPQFRYLGKFSLHGDKVADREMYEFLAITNTNVSNERRDPTAESIFCEINVAKESREQLSKEDALLEAMNAAKNMPIEKAKEIASALLWPSSEEPDVLRNRLRKFAHDSPDVLNKMYKDPATKIKSEINDALNSDVITYNIVDSTIMMGQSVLATLDIRTDSNHIEAFYEFTQQAANGKDVLENIRKQMKSIKKEKV